jgi:hypothetical protein
MYLEELSKTTKRLCQDNRFPIRDVNPKPPEYEAGLLTTRPRRKYVRRRMVATRLVLFEVKLRLTGLRMKRSRRIVWVEHVARALGAGKKVQKWRARKQECMKFRIVFWDVLSCKIIVDRRFRGTFCLHHQGLSEPSAKGSQLYRRTWNLT